MLRINHLMVSYGPHQVLKGISLEVSAGEVVGLIGPNGAGKSSLIRAASGVIPAQAGRVLADGKDLLALPPMQRARYLAVVPQAVSMPPAYSVWETVLMGRTPYLNFLGQAGLQDEQIVRQSLAKVDALALAERRVGELSGGEQQRVLLARALAQSTPILLLDEPTVHLDLQHQIGLMETVRSLAHETNLAVLIALHDLNMAARYADRLALLVDGEIRAIGAPKEVLTQAMIQSAFHLEVEIVPHPFADVPWVLAGKK